MKIAYLNYQGEAVEEEAEELFAVCIQHEMDHLKGVLFIDHLSRLKRDRAITKVKKARRAAKARAPRSGTGTHPATVAVMADALP